MKSLRIPDFPTLHGEEAIKALGDFIGELKEQRGKELSEKQAAAMIKLAEGLISTIEKETQSKPSKPIRKYIPETVRRLFS